VMKIFSGIRENIFARFFIYLTRRLLIVVE